VLERDDQVKRKRVGEIDERIRGEYIGSRQLYFVSYLLIDI